MLYTVSKEKHVSPLFVAVRLFLDVLQLWLLIVMPENGYMIRSDWLFWRIVSFIGAPAPRGGGRKGCEPLHAGAATAADTLCARAAHVVQV